ncbi:MAG: hypothetical protein K2P76_13625 [Lachnospiraceae bacterium]|nr:hypothetical protein [Lachnospiraceae bacterium]
MEKADVKSVVENRFRELGAEQLELYPSGTCWTMNGEFYKVSTLTDFWALEWTDNHSYKLSQHDLSLATNYWNERHIHSSEN